MSPISMIVADSSPTFTATVVIAGISIVLGVLLLLILVFKVFGMIAPKIDAYSTAREQKKAEKAKNKTAQNISNNTAAGSVKQEAKPVAGKKPSPPAPTVESGIPNETVAAIAAAVVASEGSGVVIRTIKKKNVSGRNPWAQAANIDNTRPF